MGHPHYSQNAPDGAEEGKFLSFGSIKCHTARVWTKKHRRIQEYVDNANAPYVYLEYSPTQNGPSGFSLINIGKENAIRVQINEIQIGGKRARFAELPAIRNNAQPQTTYSQETELRTLISGLPVGTPITVSVDYWSLDNLRKFRTNCIFDYQEDVRLSLNKHHRELLSH